MASLNLFQIVGIIHYWNLVNCLRLLISLKKYYAYANTVLIFVQNLIIILNINIGDFKETDLNDFRIISVANGTLRCQTTLPLHSLNILFKFKCATSLRKVFRFSSSMKIFDLLFRTFKMTTCNRSYLFSSKSTSKRKSLSVKYSFPHCQTRCEYIFFVIKRRCEHKPQAFALIFWFLF